MPKPKPTERKCKDCIEIIPVIPRKVRCCSCYKHTPTTLPINQFLKSYLRKSYLIYIMPKPKPTERKCKDCPAIIPVIPRRVRCCSCYIKCTNYTKIMMLKRALQASLRQAQ